eukprot:3128-Heterococcus_DN1.PRE.2
MAEQVPELKNSHATYMCLGFCGTQFLHDYSAGVARCGVAKCPQSSKHVEAISSFGSGIPLGDCRTVTCLHARTHSHAAPARNSPQEPKKARLWGGRFRTDTDPVMEKFNNSINFDKRMWAQASNAI